MLKLRLVLMNGTPKLVRSLLDGVAKTLQVFPLYL